MIALPLSLLLCFSFAFRCVSHSLPLSLSSCLGFLALLLWFRLLRNLLGRMFFLYVSFAFVCLFVFCVYFIFIHFYFWCPFLAAMSFAGYFVVRFLSSVFLFFFSPTVFPWFGLVWFGLVWFGLVWFGLVWFGLVWFGLVWFGLVWFGLVWFGLVWFGSVYPVTTAGFIDNQFM